MLLNGSLWKSNKSNNDKLCTHVELKQFVVTRVS